MEIFHLSAECYPIVKVGGLADVVGALPKYLQNLGQRASVVIPGYNNAFVEHHHFDQVFTGEVKLGNLSYPFFIMKETNDSLGFPIFMIHIPGLFDRGNVYSYADDSERFIAFQLAFLNWIVAMDITPDIIHCHDHHTALIPFFMLFVYPYRKLKNIPTVLTIHNGQYQGWFGYDKLHLLPNFPVSEIGFLDWNKLINPLGAGIKCAWKITTVSPSYLEELSIDANGLENLIRAENAKSIGILNGIDADVWDPNNDSMIEFHYDVHNVKEGKKNNKKWLCEKFGLNPNLPLFVFIGRFAFEKGADLLAEVILDLFTNLSGKLNLLILGSGDSKMEIQLKDLGLKYPEHLGIYIGYNESLAHKFYAGADFIMMPSRVEPCGLNQLYALRYGTIPIVRRTGGLKDTVIDINENGWGFCHEHNSVKDISNTIIRALNLYDSPTDMSIIQQKIMQIDHSWDKAAQEYLDLYNSFIV